MAAEEHWEFTATIPAGTPKATPLTVATTLPIRKVSRIEWHVPPGPSGLAGWRVSMGGIQVIPANAGAWLVRDGSSTGSELARLPDSGAWQVQGYNTGTFPHSLYITYYAELAMPEPKLIVPMGLGLLQPGIDSPRAHH